MSSYTRLACIVYSGEVKGEVGMRSGMCCVGWGGVGSGTFCCGLIYGNAVMKSNFWNELF